MIQFRRLDRIETLYRRAIDEFLRKLKPALPGEDLQGWLFSLEELSRHDEVVALGARIASRMVHHVNVENAKTWRDAARRSTRSQHLYRLLMDELSSRTGTRIDEMIAENSRLISSVPAEVAWTLTREIARAQQKGARAETITKMLRHRLPELTRSRVHLISRTEVAKTSTALTQARSEDLDLQFYIWRTSEDRRVRTSHRNMDGVVVPWANPPSPEALIGEKSTLGHYHSGQAPNCRCTQLVVLSLEDVFRGRSSARVYDGNRIVRMTRAQFARFTGIPSRVAA